MHSFIPQVKKQDGQILLVVVLVMVIALTVGLSLASRSITNLKTTTEESNSQKAFSAAEAGIERTLKNPTPIPIAQDLGNNAQIQSVSIDPINGSELVLNNGNPIPQDDGIDLWLSDYSPSLSQAYQNPWSGKLLVYWGSKTGCSDAALEIIILSGTKLAPTIQRYAVDACSARTAVNHFSLISGGGKTINTTVFTFGTSLQVTNGLIAHIVPLYAGTPLGFVGQDSNGIEKSLPAQGKIFSAIGKAGNTVRKISYFQLYDSIPSEYYYALFQTKQ
jgi:hypothetical protein